MPNLGMDGDRSPLAQFAAHYQVSCAMPLVSAGNAKWLGLTLEISYFRASTAGDIIKADRK